MKKRKRRFDKIYKERKKGRIQDKHGNLSDD